MTLFHWAMNSKNKTNCPRFLFQPFCWKIFQNDDIPIHLRFCFHRFLPVCLRKVSQEHFDPRPQDLKRWRLHDLRMLTVNCNCLYNSICPTLLNLQLVETHYRTIKFLHIKEFFLSFSISPEVQFLSLTGRWSWLYGVRMSYRSASLCSLAGRYDKLTS